MKKIITSFFTGTVVIVLLSSFQADTDFSYKLIVFEGSDWCSTCRRLEKTILSNSAFHTYLRSKDIALEKIDFPQRKKLSKTQKKYNERIAEKYAFDGQYPSLLITNEDGSRFLKITYFNETVDSLIDKIQTTIEQLQ